MAIIRRTLTAALLALIALILAGGCGTTETTCENPDTCAAAPVDGCAGLADAVAPDAVDAAAPDAPAPDAASDTVLDGAVDGGDAAAVAPVQDLRCGRCHVVADLQRDTGSEHLAAGLWLREAGEGLVRYDPGAPLDGTLRFALRWPARGRHPLAFDEVTAASCSGCHPVEPDGRGHASTQYDAPAREAAHATGGVGCAGACHDWLPAEQLAAAPFAPAESAAPQPVPTRPAALLSAVDGAHARLWSDGFVATGPRADLRNPILAPGCAGCHGAALDLHGAIPGCLDCHEFGGFAGAVHGDHVGWILAGRDTNDPDGAGRSPCLYCHDTNDPDADSPDETFRAACYNCHLSAHQPLDATGQAHFWPLPD